jgi:hypothetical protein
MAWEKRRSPRGRFFYRAERRDGKVVKTYVGSQTSPVVQFIGRIDRNVRALTHLNHAAERADDAAERDRIMSAYDVRSALIKKLFWRSRSMTSRGAPQKKLAAAASRDTANGDLPTQAEFLALVGRAEKGSERAQAELRGLLDRNPELWQTLGDLGSLVESYLIDLAAQKSFLLRESVRRRLVEVRDQLRTSDHDPLEEFLVRRVVTSWLEVELRQIQAVQAQGEPMNRKQQRRLDQAQRRHVESINSLRDFQGKQDGSDKVDSRMPSPP